MLRYNLISLGICTKLYFTQHTGEFMKNPFELRYDLLALTHDHLDKQYKSNLAYAETMIKEAVAAGYSMSDALAKYMPKFPTIEDVVKEAKKFYNFVDTSK